MPHLPHVAPETLDLDASRLQRAYDLLEEWTSGPAPVFPAAALLVGRRGKVVAPRFFGRQGPEPDAAPLRDDGMFLMASISKPVTYLGGLILVERGLLNLGTPVTRYLPDFAAHHKESTLVLHLFTHTSGLPDMLENNAQLRRDHAPLQRFIEGAIRDTVPLFPPGTNCRYQSMGTLVVAALIQELTGLSIREFLQREIFTPLGMRSTSLGASDALRERLVRVRTPEYQAGGDFGWNSRYWQDFGAPWGGLFSTPEDFAVLCQLMLNGGSYGGVRLLSPWTVEMMTTNRLDDQAAVPEAVRRAEPWGLGWRMNHPGTDDSWSDLLGRQVFGHTGATGTLVWMDRRRQGFCILLTTEQRSKVRDPMRQISNLVAASFH